MKIIVCSKNKAKNDAVKYVMKKFFIQFEIVSYETKSLVSVTPSGDDEGICGCINRINDALGKCNDGDLYVAMEGILSPTSYGTFLCGWTVIYDKTKNNYYYGCSAKVRVPDEVINNLSKNQRLSSVVANYMSSTDEEVSQYGTNGILTNGVYTRTDEFIDSITCAISSNMTQCVNENKIM